MVDKYIWGNKNMTAANNNSGGMAVAGADPMIPATGNNNSPNATGVPNVPNYFLVGANEQNMGTTRTSTISTGGVTGAASGTHSAIQQPIQGSGHYLVQGMPATRLGDSGIQNCGNTVGTQVAPSQTKVFIMS